MSQSTTRPIRFSTAVGVPLEASFDAGRLTSDGGLPWLQQAESEIGLCAAFATQIPEWRRGPVRHPLATLVRQRVFQLACGYEDQDDADTLRTDPLLKLVFGGETDQLVAAVLRPGNAHGSRGAVAVLRRIVRAIRTRWPGVHIELRADSGFAVPAVYDFCEQAGIGYTIGLVPNPRLEALAAVLLAEALRQHATTGQKVRLAGETAYQAESWPHPRRVIFKAEALAKGPNTRFVVTSRTDEPLALYDWYVDRGEPEQWVGDLKLGCFADRLSCHRFWANQFRLLLAAAAYWLLDTLRRWLIQRGLERLELRTLRLRLLKIGGRVHQLLTRIRLHLATSHPAEPLWRLLASPHLDPVNNPG